MNSRQDINQTKIAFLKSILRLYEKPEVPPSDRLRKLQKATGRLLKECSTKIDMLFKGKKIDGNILVLMTTIDKRLDKIKELEAREDQEAARIKWETENIVESIEPDEDPIVVKKEEDTVTIKEEENPGPDIKMEDAPPVEIKMEQSTPVRIKRGPSED